MENASSEQNVADAPISATTSSAQVKYAGFWIRFVAAMVDGLIISITIGILSFIIMAITEIPQNNFSGVLNLIASVAYYCIMTSRSGATFGKKLVGITVKSDSLEKLSTGKVILRETVGKFLSGITLTIGYIMVAFTQKKQGLHDKLAHSVVVYKDPS